MARRRPREIMWLAMNHLKYAAVVPAGFRHSEGDCGCWCNPTVSTYDETAIGDGNQPEPFVKPLIVHQLRTHAWRFEPGKGPLICRVCGVTQTMKNADGFCRGPRNLFEYKGD